MQEIRNYSEAINFIHSRRKFTKDPTLERMRRLAELLGHPENNLNMIHVTGTNGKGSVAAYLRDLLLGQGYDVGTFTSPFIVKFNERISVNGQMITDQEIFDLVQKILPVIEKVDHEYQKNGGGPTEFEVITLMMLLYFSQHQPDFVIVEVGIGGMFDATNIITPLLSVITTVGMDHMKILGNTITAIAQQKAGIIKKGVPVVAGLLPVEAQKAVKSKAQETESDVYFLGTDFSYKAKNISNRWGEVFDYRFGQTILKNVRLQMVGDFQAANASVALTCFIVLLGKMGQSVQKSQLSKSLQRTSWPGRFEKVNDEPLIILDGAHNLPAMQEIVKTLRSKFASTKIYVLLAILQDKQFEQMIKELEKVANVTVVVTTFNSPRETFAPKTLAAKHPNLRAIDNWNEAMVGLVNEMSADDMLLITGSLYFVSEVRKYFK